MFQCLLHMESEESLDEWNMYLLGYLLGTFQHGAFPVLKAIERKIKGLKGSILLLIKY